MAIFLSGNLSIPLTVVNDEDSSLRRTMMLKPLSDADRINDGLSG